MNQQSVLSGWGNVNARACEVYSLRSLVEHQQVLRESSEVTPRGLGRAYGDSAQGNTVLDETRRSHFHAFDTEQGVIVCEAGVTLAEVLEVAVPKGWFLPTTPGTKFVTVGGAVAADVHGKNHHVDGSFGEYVEEIDLLLASGEVVRCGPRESSELFWATVGGMGLTGVILRVTFRLLAIETAYCKVDYHRTANLEETLEHFAATDEEQRYSVAWIDCLSAGEQLGRSVVMSGDHIKREELASKHWAKPLEQPAKGGRSVPFYFPGFALNRMTVGWFNALYYRRHPNATKTVDYDTYFYPLDSILHWNRIYGRQGFLQYQALLPHESSAVGLTKILETLERAGCASFLAVLKRSGRASQGLLSFLYPGHTLALDIPFRGQKVLDLTRRLDEIVLEYGGRLYLAKDAVMTASTFASMYPRLDEFRRIKAEVDPHNRFTSDQAKRLAIVPVEEASRVVG